MEDILVNEGTLQKMVLRANNHIDRDTILNLRGTKALKVEDMSNTDNEYDNRETWGELLLSAHNRPMVGVDVTTWSSLIRNVLDIIRPQLQYAYTNTTGDEVRAVFEICLNKICDEIDLKLNSNCPKRLFKEAEETDLIKSSVYLSNKNHMIKIFTDEEGIDWYMCAVYTGEIIVMIEALLDTIYALAEDYTPYSEKIKDFPHHTLILSYVHREDIVDGQGREEAREVFKQISGIDDEIQRLELSKDLLQIQKKLAHISAVTVEAYNEIENIQKKYNLKTLDDLLNSIQ